MAAVQFNCPHCAGLFQVDDSMAGQQVGCPSCGGLLVLPAMNPSTAPLQTPPSMPESSPPHTPVSPTPQPTATNPSPGAMYPPGMQPPASSGRSDNAVHQQPATPLYPPGQGQTARPVPVSPDGMLPPGAGTASPSNRPISANTAKAASQPMSVPGGVDQASTAKSLLPPGSERATSAGSKVESMLPPGSQSPSSPVAANVRPDTPAVATDEKQSGPVVIPTEDGNYVALREPVKTVGYGDDEVELRQLTAEEKARRRLKKNLILWGFGLLVIGVTLAILLAVGPVGS